MQSFSPKTLPSALNMMTYGVNAFRFSMKRKAFKEVKLYLLEEDPSFLQYVSDTSKKPFNSTRINLSSIRDITDTPSFSIIAPIFKKPPQSPQNLLCLDLGQNTFFAMGFNTEEQKNLFWQGLQHQIEIMKSDNKKNRSLNSVVKDLFLGYDVDGDQTLSKAEIRNLLVKLHIPMTLFAFNELFKKFDKNSNGSLEFDEFVEMMKERLYKKELEGLFVKHCAAAKKDKLKKESEIPLMEFNEFKRFLSLTQNERYTERQIKELLDPFFNDNKEERDYKLSFLTFCNILFSFENSVFDPSKENIYQNMDRPLTDYYINSSHNTYLLANQLTGESSVQAYINAFMKGCRCVELDCWDGDDKEPVVTHGHTLTSKILFADVIDIVKEHAFRQNPFPVILSIENHCHLEQKDRMADILKQKLGDALYLLPNDWEKMKHFPSPKDLQYRILIKDKADLAVNNKIIPDKICESDDSDDEEEAKEEKQALSKEASTEKPANISQKLYNLITLFGVSLKIHGPRVIWNISSLSENQLEKYLKKHEKELIAVNNTSFTRIFPGGFRVDSSNYDPIPAFMAGSQVIALNFQKNDQNLLLYLSKFIENGGIYSGYVLKPDFLRENGFSYSSFNKPRLEITIKIKSAQFLRPLSNKEVTDVIDPFIEVACRGIEKDCAVKKTGIIQNNGLNPKFKGKNNKFVFKVHCPEIAMLLFSAYDENSLKNERVAWYALPVSCLRTGYRVVPLRNCEDLDYFELSSIFCKISIKKEL